MATETFTFTSRTPSRNASPLMSCEPAPGYTELRRNEEANTAEPRSVFSIKCSDQGDLEVSSNREIVQITLKHGHDRWTKPIDFKKSTKVVVEVLKKQEPSITHKKSRHEKSTNSSLEEVDRDEDMAGENGKGAMPKVKHIGNKKQTFWQRLNCFGA